LPVVGVVRAILWATALLRWHRRGGRRCAAFVAVRVATLTRPPARRRYRDGRGRRDRRQWCRVGPPRVVLHHERHADEQQREADHQADHTNPPAKPTVLLSQLLLLGLASSGTSQFPRRLGVQLGVAEGFTGVGGGREPLTGRARVGWPRRCGCPHAWR